MIDIRNMQNEHREWVDKNFPGETLQQATLGVCEEAGELAHSVLKMDQGIRGSREQHREDALDAIADMFIFGLSVCDHLDASAEVLLALTWDKVKKRDWQKDPQSGGEDSLLSRETPDTVRGRRDPQDQMVEPHGAADIMPGDSDYRR